MGPVKSITIFVIILISLIILIFLLGTLFQIYLEFFRFKRFIKVKIKELKAVHEHREVSFDNKLANSKKGILYDWDKLKNSIQHEGLKNPIRVLKTDTGYVVVDGHHRLRVLKELYDENYEIKVTLINKVI